MATALQFPPSDQPAFDFPQSLTERYMPASIGDFAGLARTTKGDSMTTQKIKSLLLETFAGAMAAADGEVSADSQLSSELEKVFRAVTGEVVLSSIACAIAADDLSDSIAAARKNLFELSGRTVILPDGYNGDMEIFYSTPVETYGELVKLAVCGKPWLFRWVFSEDLRRAQQSNLKTA